MGTSSETGWISPEEETPLRARSPRPPTGRCSGTSVRGDGLADGAGKRWIWGETRSAPPALVAAPLAATRISPVTPRYLFSRFSAGMIPDPVSRLSHPLPATGPRRYRLLVPAHSLAPLNQVKPSDSHSLADGNGLREGLLRLGLGDVGIDVHQQRRRSQIGRAHV